MARSGESETPSSQSGARLVAAAGLVFIVALALRGAHLLGLEHSLAGTPLIDTPRGDALYHWNEAIALLAGDPAIRARVPSLGLGPVRACWLRLKLADLDLLEGQLPQARARLARVRRDCPSRGGRLAAKLADLETRTGTR